MIYPIGGASTAFVYLFRAQALISLCARAFSVPLGLFVTLHRHREAVQKLGNQLRSINGPRGVGTVSQAAKSKQARGSFVSLSSDLAWLLPKFEKFQPEFWYFGVVLLVQRLYVVAPRTSLLLPDLERRPEAAGDKCVENVVFRPLGTRQACWLLSLLSLGKLR